MPVFVNKKEISDDEIHGEMQYHPAATIDEARREASRALIIRELLLNAAVDENLVEEIEISTVTGEREEQIIELLLKKVIQVPVADQATCKRYYDQHLDRFKDSQTGNVLPFKIVNDHIENYLADKGHQAALSAYIDRLMDKSAIIGM